MTEHHASIHWQRIPVGSDYSRDHHWSIPNGARVAASASAALVPPPLTGDQRFDPEQGFVASIAACHMLWFLTLAEQRGWPVQGYVDQAVGVLAKPAGGRLSIENYEQLRPAFGSHNLRSLSNAVAWARNLNVPQRAYEIQMLYGMAEDGARFFFNDTA
ncbi:MAG: proline dehydrogenase family protein, partial [Xanthomonadales bacterium]|nr:proline dehydrogenase family protein [Xanthomonadales bacterium]